MRYINPIRRLYVFDVKFTFRNWWNKSIMSSLPYNIKINFPCIGTDGHRSWMRIRQLPGWLGCWPLSSIFLSAGASDQFHPHGAHHSPGHQPLQYSRQPWHAICKGAKTVNFEGEAFWHVLSLAWRLRIGENFGRSFWQALPLYPRLCAVLSRAWSLSWNWYLWPEVNHKSSSLSWTLL